jgi:hypothetical protein
MSRTTSVVLLVELRECRVFDLFNDPFLLERVFCTMKSTDATAIRALTKTKQTRSSSTFFTVHVPTGI